MSDTMRTLYGVPIAPAKRVPLDRLTRHPMNPARAEDREASRILTADIKEQGIDKPILITGDYQVLRGWRRVEAARKAGDKAILAETVVGKVEDPGTLRKLIFRDNFLRQSYTYEEIDAFILKLYGKDRILAPLPRGPKASASKSYRQLLPMERILEVELGMSLGAAKQHLGSIRRYLKSQEAGSARLSLTDEDERSGLSMARRWQACQARIDRAEKTIASIRKKAILPEVKEQKGIERELRKIGGLDRFLRRIK